MKITFVGHASILVETGGVRILCDPWWRGPCFGAQWWTYPAPFTAPVAEGIDYIYVSHGHHDHFHPGTLRTLPRTATGLVSASIGLAADFRQLGFNVVEIDDLTAHELGKGVRCRIIETHGADTLLAIEDGEEVCVNLNDALHAAPAPVQDEFIGRLRSLYPRIDYLFCGYGVASHFPNCYEIPGKDREATAARRQAYFTGQWSRIAAALAPRFAFPFAADVALLEHDLLWANLPTHNSRRPIDVFRARHPEATTTVIDIAPGFVIENGNVLREVLRAPMTVERLQAECRDGIARSNTYGPVGGEVFDEVLALLRANVARCEPYLREHRGDYRFLIRFRNFPQGIEVLKSGDEVALRPVQAADESGYELVYTTRLHYLRASLTSPFGHEILFVGSGGIFRYARARDAKRNLHRELAVLLAPQTQAPRSRFGTDPAWLHRFKRLARRWLGATTTDLYDLGFWTQWHNEGRRP